MFLPWAFLWSSCISIHALHEEGDQLTRDKRWKAAVFLSTPSTRRATLRLHPHRRYSAISIHALHEEGDLEDNTDRGRMNLFLSTPSTRRATRLCGRGLLY